MKKSIFLLGMAVAALASCTNEEVTQVAENRAIKFSPFVNNNTKAVTEITSKDALTSFYVFGNYGVEENGSTWAGQAFNNEPNSAEYHWQVGNYYRFGAYADGVGNKIENAQYSAVNKKLTFPDYTPDDAKDLVAAVGTGNAFSTAPADAVSLNFKHMLSQVRLTFTTKAAATYKITISDVKITNAVKTAVGTYTDGAVAWTTSTTGEYVYDNLTTDAIIAVNDAAYQSKLVIPQENTDDVTVTFKATITGEKPSGSTTLEKVFTGNLAHNLNSNGQSANTWKNQYRYNYTTSIDITDIVDNPDDLVKITFSPSLEEWKNASEGDIDITIPGE